jgi:ankyrin repeat protein
MLMALRYCSAGEAKGSNRKNTNKGLVEDLRSERDLSGSKETVLIFTVKNHPGEVMRILRKMTSKEMNATDEYGKTALDYAVESGNFELVRGMSKCGARRNENSQLDVDGKLWLYLDPAFNVDPPRILQDITDILCAGANLNTRNGHGQTVLMRSVIKFDKEVALLLINNGADVNAKDNGGVTALMYASGSLEVAEYLIANGADVNEKSNSGGTALMEASFRGNTALVKLLVANGADVNAHRNNGTTALSSAAEGWKQHQFLVFFKEPDHKHVIDHLIKNGAEDPKLVQIDLSDLREIMGRDYVVRYLKERRDKQRKTD